jgi:integrase
LFIFGGIKPLSPTTINRRKLEACEKANIRPITLHQFRHSHATLLLQKGIMINEVSRRLGHSKTSTTLDIYSHTDLTQEKRVLNTLNSLRFSCFSTLKYKLKSLLKRF